MWQQLIPIQTYVIRRSPDLSQERLFPIFFRKYYENGNKKGTRQETALCNACIYTDSTLWSRSDGGI